MADTLDSSDDATTTPSKSRARILAFDVNDLIVHARVDTDCGCQKLRILGRMKDRDARTKQFNMIIIKANLKCMMISS
jgi:hypothetical protein